MYPDYHNDTFRPPAELSKLPVVYFAMNPGGQAVIGLFASAVLVKEAGKTANFLYRSVVSRIAKKLVRSGKKMTARTFGWEMRLD